MEDADLARVVEKILQHRRVDARHLLARRSFGGSRRHQRRGQLIRQRFRFGRGRRTGQLPRQFAEPGRVG